MANKADLSIGIVAVAPSPATSGLTLELEGGQGDDMPDVPFKALAYPPDVIPTRYNSERILVTARTGDELTIERAVGVTSAQAIDEGWIVSNNIFADDFLGSISVVTKETPVGAVNGSNKLFYTDEPYVGGSLQAYVNGLAQSDFITETEPSLGEFEFDVAPLTGDNVRVAYQFALTSSNNADTVDGYHAASSPTPNMLVPLDENGRFDHATLPLDAAVQRAYTQSGSSATGTTTIPSDDTIPQITEGTQFMTLSITPKSATNLLLIEAKVFMSHSVPADLIAALFRDSTANAIAADVGYGSDATEMQARKIWAVVVAGSTSATTFRIRAGGHVAGTTTFNGQSGSRRFGGAILSGITITEYKA